LALSIAILIIAKPSSGLCPDAELIEPCTCVFDNFSCAGTTLYNYKTLFDRISKSLTPPEKVFRGIEISNEAITEIEDDEFRDLSFSEISIRNAKNLKRIYAHAFTNIADKITSFTQSGPSLLGDQDEHVAELFQALSTLVNVKQIILGQTRLKFIPANAFSNINQNKLTHLEINSGLIASVGNRAFYYLNALNYLRLENQQLNKIAAHAFDLEKSSSVILDIYLNGNDLEDSSLEVNAFVGTNRPITLNLASNQLTHLKVDIFKPILSANINTKIDVKDNPFRCNCEVAWLVRQKTNYSARISNAVCKGNPHPNSALFDLRAADFLDCPDTFKF
jgi:hypothetical protein